MINLQKNKKQGVGVLADSIVSLRHVEKWFGENHVVKDMNLEIEEGEFLTLLGPSGCGKTTTLRMIAGFEDATSGVIEVQGEDVRAKEPYQRDVNTVFQNYSLFPHMTVFDNVAYGPTIRKEPKNEIKTRVMEMLELVQMNGYEKRKPDALSGGQKQRVAIARALINNPRVLLLDEPLGALDLKLRKQMQVELKRLQKKLGITFVYVTHDQEEAMTMSDRIAVLRDGIIEQLGKPMDIYQRPTTRFVADFIGESNLFDGVVKFVMGSQLAVLTPSGMIAAIGEGFSVGEEISVSVRPEYLSVSREPGDGYELPARIKDFIYMGTVVKTSLDMPDGKEIKYSCLDPDESLREGDEVYVHWDPAKSVAIHKEKAVASV
jgi:spermidine/putrescine transport system ATP-binding protein